MAPRSRTLVCGLEAETSQHPESQENTGDLKSLRFWGWWLPCHPAQTGRAAKPPGHFPLGGAPSPPTPIYAGRGAQGSRGEQERSCLRSPADVGQQKAVLSYFGHGSNNSERSEQCLCYRPQAHIQPCVLGVHQECADGDLGLLPWTWDASALPRAYQ